MKKSNIVACWRGSYYDSSIANDSTLKEQFATSAATLPSTWWSRASMHTMPSYASSKSKTQAKWQCNFAHLLTQMIVECLNGVLKQYISCLGSLLHFTHQKWGILIIDCAVLHNLVLKNADNEKEHEDENDHNFNYVDHISVQDHAPGFAKWHALIADYFSWRTQPWCALNFAITIINQLEILSILQFLGHTIKEFAPGITKLLDAIKRFMQERQ